MHPSQISKYIWVVIFAWSLTKRIIIFRFPSLKHTTLKFLIFLSIWKIYATHQFVAGSRPIGYLTWPWKLKNQKILAFTCSKFWQLTQFRQFFVYVLHFCILEIKPTTSHQDTYLCYLDEPFCTSTLVLVRWLGFCDNSNWSQNSWTILRSPWLTLWLLWGCYTYCFLQWLACVVEGKSPWGMTHRDVYPAQLSASLHVCSSTVQWRDVFQLGRLGLRKYIISGLHYHILEIKTFDLGSRTRDVCS